VAVAPRSQRGAPRFVDENLDENRAGSRLALRASMHKLTVLTLLSLSLTTACMSEASWPHRDRAGFPVSTWKFHAWERENACRGDIARAAEVAPDSLGERQRVIAARCGHGDPSLWRRGGRYSPPVTPPPFPSVPTRPDAVRSPSADAVAQGVSRR
jgi:hypothetical protein